MSAEHYAYVAPGEGASFDARVATSARDVKVRQQHRYAMSNVLATTRLHCQLATTCSGQTGTCTVFQQHDLRYHSKAVV